MTESASTFMAIVFGLGVFAMLMAVGWRSVQNRRILRLQGADGRETIIVAPEDDAISSISTTTTTTTTETAEAAPGPASASDPSAADVDTGVAEPQPVPEFDRKRR